MLHVSIGKENEALRGKAVQHVFNYQAVIKWLECSCLLCSGAFMGI